MPEPTLFLVVAQHGWRRLQGYVIAEDAEAAVKQVGGEIAVAGRQAGVLRVYPVVAGPGSTEAMTDTDVLDAIEARLNKRRAGREATCDR